jgi:predicted ATPase/DNA-binding CsgD family transcriptional regulator
VSVEDHTDRTDEPETTRGNVPIALTPLIGRGPALEELRSLLARTRLLTLCGPGGVGKSRLAAALAEGVREEFAGGAWWADLSDIVDVGLVAQGVATAVLPDASVNDPVAAIARALAASSLLVLDNCEQVVNGCGALVVELLARAPALRITATSRQSLGIAGEQVWRVAGLVVDGPEPIGRVPDPDGNAVSLFMARAQAATAQRFAPQAPETEQAVAEICRWLDGMPLAIELAAARVNVLSVSQIAERIKRDSGLLRQTTPTAPERQRTLQDTLEWSHQLLAPAEQRLFARLGVFRGSFSLAAAEMICADEALSEGRILDLLSRLIDQSLVQVVDSAEAPRYRLLATVRHYALGKLEAAGELEATSGRHATFFSGLGHAARGGLGAGDQLRWLARLELAHDNLAEALRWLFAHSPAQAVELASELWPFSYQRGYYREARSWFEQALACGDEIPTPARIDALLKAGEVAFLQCDYPVAIDHLQAALELMGPGGDQRAAGIARQRLGSIAREQGRYAQSRAMHEQSMAIWEALGDREGVASAQDYLGFAAWLSGDFERAESVGRQALETFRQAGRLRDVASALISLGAGAIYRDELEVAAERLSEALSISRRLGFQEGIAWSLHQLAILARRRRRPAHEAAGMLHDALLVHQQLGDRWRIASVLEEIAGSVLVRRDPALAVRMLASAQELRNRIGTPVPTAESPDRDAALARLRRRLSRTAFDEERLQGRLLEVEEAIDLAVRAIETLDQASEGGLVNRTAILTPRELAVLELLARGQTNREIAAELYISPSTAGVHVSNILRKLGAKRRVDAAGLAHTLGLLPTR